MGWKKLKEKFKIEHFVHIINEEICIGSPYIPDLVTIDMKTGVYKEKNAYSDFLKSTYADLAETPSEEILKILNEPDTFKTSLPVYTFESSRIIEEFCEEYGYPNVTHSGTLMYQTSFFKDKESAIQAAKKDNQSYIDYIKKTLNDHLDKVNELTKNLEEQNKVKEELDKLDLNKK